MAYYNNKVEAPWGGGIKRRLVEAVSTAEDPLKRPYNDEMATFLLTRPYDSGGVNAQDNVDGAQAVSKNICTVAQ